MYYYVLCVPPHYFVCDIVIRMSVYYALLLISIYYVLYVLLRTCLYYIYWYITCYACCYVHPYIMYHMYCSVLLRTIHTTADPCLPKFRLSRYVSRNPGNGTVYTPYFGASFIWLPHYLDNFRWDRGVQINVGRMY